MSKEKLVYSCTVHVNDIVVCEKKCLYAKDVYYPICSDCLEHVKTYYGWKLATLFTRRFNDQKESDQYANGVRHGLMEAAAIVQGQNEKYWFPKI
jgi:hypothetical protein